MALLDEPLAAVHPTMRRIMAEFVRRWHEEGRTLMLVSHDMPTQPVPRHRIADYTYVLGLGRITAEGPRASFEGDMHAQVQAWLGLVY